MNEQDIQTNATGVESLTTSISSLIGGDTGLSVLFYNPDTVTNILTCWFVHLPSNRLFSWGPGDAIRSNLVGASGGFTMNQGVADENTGKSMLLGYLIAIGNLDLVVDDFRDPSTNAFVCTNEKLLSLL